MTLALTLLGYPDYIRTASRGTPVRCPSFFQFHTVQHTRSVRRHDGAGRVAEVLWTFPHFRPMGSPGGILFLVCESTTDKNTQRRMCTDTRHWTTTPQLACTQTHPPKRQQARQHADERSTHTHARARAHERTAHERASNLSSTSLSILTHSRRPRAHAYASPPPSSVL